VCTIVDMARLGRLGTVFAQIVGWFGHVEAGKVESFRSGAGDCKFASEGVLGANSQLVIAPLVTCKGPRRLEHHQHALESEV
jgi:hypothetical protein